MSNFNKTKLVNNKIEWSKLEMKSKNAFTLIELLAIIVILAIIAVITVPIILNIIENSKKGAAVDSAYGFKDAIQKYYITKSVENISGDLPSGYKSVSDLPSDFTVSGEKPSDGWIKLNNGTVEEYSIKIGEYVVTMNDDETVTSEKNGQINGRIEADGARYFDELITVYWNPITNQKCDKATDNSDTAGYRDSNSEVGYRGVVPTTNTNNQTQCLKWYAYSDENGYANMILDHNIGAANFADTNNTSGPLNALAYMKTAINATGANWATNAAGNTFEKYTVKRGVADYSIDYTEKENNTYKYRARMITAEEIYNIMDINWAEGAISPLKEKLFCEDKSSITQCPQGYWTATANSNYNNMVYTVSCSPVYNTNDFLYNMSPSYYGIEFGIRPVITVPTSSINS